MEILRSDQTQQGSNPAIQLASFLAAVSDSIFLLVDPRDSWNNKPQPRNPPAESQLVEWLARNFSFLSDAEGEEGLARDSTE